MTDQIASNGAIDSSAGYSISSSSEVNQSPSESVSVSNESVKKEKFFTQDQFNVASNNVKQAAIRETEARIRAEYEQRLSATQKQPNTLQQNDKKYTEEEVVQLYEDLKKVDNAKLALEKYNSSIKDLATKVGYGTEEGNKLLEESGLSDINQYSAVVPILNSLDNTVDTIKYFSDHPAKLVTISNLSHKNALKELHKISEALKKDKEASDKPRSSAPASQLKPTNYGLGGGSMSREELSSHPSFRF